MKLRVGDIEMDSEGGVGFSATRARRGRGSSGQLVVHNAISTSPTAAPRPTSEGEASAPGGTGPRGRGLPPRRLRALGWVGVTSGVGLAVAAALGAASWPVLWSLLLPSASLSAGGLLALRAATREERAIQARRAARLAALSQPVAASLEAARAPLGVEELVARLGVPEGDVVRGLLWLVETGQVTEELDLDTGHFRYTWGADPLLPGTPRAALDIRDRAARVGDDGRDS